MPRPRKFLLIDNHADNRALLARTLARKFPGAEIMEWSLLGGVVKSAAAETIDCVVLHRTNDAEAIQLVLEIRRVNAHVPILVLSGVDRSDSALKAGADGFLNFDEWLRVGTVVENLLYPPRPVSRGDARSGI